MSKELKAIIERAGTKNELFDLALQINREGIFMPDAESEELYRAWNEKFDELNELRIREIVQEEIKKAAEITTAQAMPEKLKRSLENGEISVNTARREMGLEPIPQTAADLKLVKPD